MFLAIAGDRFNARKILLGFAPTKTIRLAHLQLISTFSWQLIPNLKDRMIEESMRRQEDSKDVLTKFGKII
jgi:hypothetical protein